MSLSTAGFELAPKRTRKREFLDEMNLVVPWTELVCLIESQAPKGKNGRPPFAVSTMLRIHFTQQWFGLSGPAMEESLHDCRCIASSRRRSRVSVDYLMNPPFCSFAICWKNTN